MKKTFMFVVLVSFMLTSCNLLQAAEPTQDPLIEKLATQVAELLKPTQKVEESVQPKATEQSVNSEVMPSPVPAAPPSANDVKIGDWEITYYKGATSEMKNWKFSNLEPIVWPEFPNVDNGVYLASQGLEYGEDLTTFCQYKETCDFVVPARHYRLYTGDYKLDGVGSCFGEGKKGCALMVINVGEITASFEDQTFDAGFTVWGRYWDGKFLPQAVWALLSHASNNMLNMDSILNPTTITNAGANCSVVDGCLSVENTFVIISGNEILTIGRQTINK